MIRSLPPPVQAALLMVVANACVAAMTCAIRMAVTELHPFEVAFFRNFFGLVALLPLFVRYGTSIMRTKSHGVLLLSSCTHVVAMLGYFVAVAYLPLAEVTALSFTKPLFATIGAALVLREIVRGRRWSAVAIGFLGVLIVVQPSGATFSPYATLVLVSALASAGVVLIIKRLTGTESTGAIVFFQSVFMTLLTLPLAVATWTTPTLTQFGILAVIGGLGTIVWLCFTRAFALADASAMMPYEFLKLPFIAVLAYLLFAEVPSVWTWIGGSLIFASTIYIGHREARLGAARAALETSGTSPLVPPARPNP